MDSHKLLLEKKSFDNLIRLNLDCYQMSFFFLPFLLVNICLSSFRILIICVSPESLCQITEQIADSFMAKTLNFFHPPSPQIYTPMIKVYSHERNMIIKSSHFVCYH